MKILFIDDEPIRAKRLARLDNVEVVVAHGPEQVAFYLQHLPRNQRPDIICLDHDMPKMDGFAIAGQFLTELSIPVIVHSANNVGANKIMELLEIHEVPCIRLSVLMADWVQQVEAYINKELM